MPNMQFECSMILKGSLGSNFDIFAASGGSTAWVLLWKTRSRPIGVRVFFCIPNINFFSSAFDPREWTMVVFWKEDSGRQPRLITPKNGGDETNYPIIHLQPKFSFFDDPDVPFGPSGPPGPPGSPFSPGQPPGWPPAPSPAGDRERGGPRKNSRERLSLPHEPQLFPIPMNDDDDDQSPQEERQRGRSRSRERTYPHVQVSREPQTQPMVTPEADEV